MNLIEALQAEANKTRKFIADLDEAVDLLGPDAGLAISKVAHQGIVKSIDAAIASGDVVQMVSLAAQLGVGEGGDE